MIVITWDWFSFVVGLLTAVTVAFWAVFFIAFKQYSNQKKRAKAMETDNIDRLFAAWAGRDNKDVNGK